MKTTLVVRESPWTENGQLQPWSMRPFIEGLAELYNARLVYRTFTTARELRRLLSHEAIDGSQGRVIVYLACHGHGGRLAIGRDSDGANLAPIADDLRLGVECVWLGACDLGASRALTKFLERGGAVWAGGYLCAVDWDASLLLDLSVLQGLLQSGPITTKKQVLAVLGKALKGFAPGWVVGSDSNDCDVELRSALRVVARDKARGGGAKPKDISDTVRARLGWHL